MPPLRARKAAGWASRPALAPLFFILVLSATAAQPVDPPLFIHGGTVVNHDRSFRADVVVEGGLVTAVGLGLAVPFGARLLNATGLLVMPGGIEARVGLPCGA